MNDWNLDSSLFSSLFRDLYDITDDEIKQAHREAQRRFYFIEPVEALLAYMRKQGITWRQLAPPSDFNRTQVHLWQEGDRRPNPDNIAKIKRFNHIPDTEVPTPSPEEAGVAACAEALKILRDRRRPALGPPGRMMNAHLYRALELALGDHPNIPWMPNAFVRDRLLTAIAHDISRTIPLAKIDTPKDLDQVLNDWVGPYTCLVGVLDDDEDDV